MKNRCLFFSKRAVFIFVAAIIVSVFGLSGCSKKPPEPGRYYNNKDSFSIKFPPEWEFNEEELVALSPQEGENDEFPEHIAVCTEDLPVSLSIEDYFKLSVTNCQKEFSNFIKVADGKINIDNAEARWIIYSFKEEELECQNVAYMLVKKRKAYVISGNALVGTFENYKSKFEEIAKTFRFE